MNKPTAFSMKEEKISMHSKFSRYHTKLPSLEVENHQEAEHILKFFLHNLTPKRIFYVITIFTDFYPSNLSKKIALLLRAN